MAFCEEKGGDTMEQRRWTILLISFTFALSAVLGGFVYQKHLEIEELHLEGRDREALAFSQLRESAAAVDLALRKGQHATSPEVFSALGLWLYGQSTRARGALLELPVEREESVAFFQRVGSFAQNFVQTAHERSGHSPSELAYLLALSETATLLAEHLVEGSALKVLPQVEAELARLVPVFAPTEPGSLTVTLEAAQESLAAFMDLRESVFRPLDPCDSFYHFRARVDGGEFVAEVLRGCGRVVRAANSREVRKASLSVEEGLEKAQDFLLRNGFSDMVPRQWRREANQVTADFVALESGVLLYPAWVSLRVGLDNGRITGFSAAEHWAYPRALDDLEPTVTKEEALNSVPDTLSVEGYDMALTVSTDGREVLCYVFHGRGEDGGLFLVYVDASTGRQQKIRLLLAEEMGQFFA